MARGIRAENGRNAFAEAFPMPHRRQTASSAREQVSTRVSSAKAQVLGLCLPNLPKNRPRLIGLFARVKARGGNNVTRALEGGESRKQSSLEIRRMILSVPSALEAEEQDASLAAGQASIDRLFAKKRFQVPFYGFILPHRP